MSVLGVFVAGGAPTSDGRTSHRSWTAKNVLQWGAGSRVWKAGATVSRSVDSDFDLPNPAGAIQFSTLEDYENALKGAPTGTWFVTRGRADTRYASTTAALFIETELLRSKDAVIRGGLRTDHRTRGGVMLSPRLFAAARVGSYVLRAGGGLFVHNWSNNIFIQSRKGDGSLLRSYIVKGVSFRDVRKVPPASEPSVVSRIVADLTRQRDIMLKGSVERLLGKAAAGIEYTFTRRQHLLGTRRLPTQTGWSDLLESSRSSRSHQLHTRVQAQWKGQSVVAHYQWVMAHDDTDGPFSYPERQHDIRAEWARRSGVSPHVVGVIGSFNLPRDVSLSAVFASRSPAPYHVTTGVDAAGNGLFVDRGGRSRNSTPGPGYKSLSLFGHRRVPMPRALVRSKERLYVDIGLKADNILNNKNYVALGSVIGSPLAGRPLGALPGRSFRLWFSLGQ